MDEIKFIVSRENDLCLISNLIEMNEIPIRVTHNDTKINNVLINKDSKEAVCVIDLDTVMPGSALYDFGDAVRSGAATRVEDDNDYNSVSINLDYFEAFTDSYLSETYDILTDKEKKYLVFSVKLLTLELAMRFLDDYINGDTYFKCNYEDHNLVRARNQIKLVEEIENNFEIMETIVSKICKKYEQKTYKKINN